MGDRTAELAEYEGDRTDLLPAGRATPAATTLAAAAPHASCEDLTLRDSPEEEEDDDLATPTGSLSLSSTPLGGGSGASSLAATPTRHAPPPLGTL